MKFKTAKPEDFPDVEGIRFKTIKAYSKVSSDLLIVLIKAYSKVSSDLLIVLIKVDTAIKVYDESERSEDDLEWFLDFLKRTIKEFEDTE